MARSPIFSRGQYSRHGPDSDALSAAMKVPIAFRPFESLAVSRASTACGAETGKNGAAIVPLRHSWPCSGLT